MDLISQIEVAGGTKAPSLERQLGKICALPFEATQLTEELAVPLTYFENQITVNFPGLEIDGIATRFVFTDSFKAKFTGGIACGSELALLSLNAGEESKETRAIRFDQRHSGPTKVSYQGRRLKGPVLESIAEHLKAYRKELKKTANNNPLDAHVIRAFQ